MNTKNDTRFRKGQSGNPKGRPRGRAPSHPILELLKERKTTNQNGKMVELTGAEALELKISQKALLGDFGAVKTVLGWMLEREQLRFANHKGPPILPQCFPIRERDSDNAFEAMRLLGVGVKVREPYEQQQDFPLDCAWVELMPWAVEAALAREPELALDDDLMNSKFRHMFREHKSEWGW